MAMATVSASATTGARTQLRTSSSARAALVQAPVRVRPSRRFAAIRATAETAVEATSNGAKSVSVKDDAEIRYLSKRAEHVTKHFNTAMGVDDFMQRLEIALWGFGFQNDNSIAMVNLCRDEVTHTLKHKIDQVFGSSFCTNGLGGVLTCGVTGVGAGLSHSPVCETSGKERYVFFSFPHIGIDSAGVVGNISRPGRSAMSCACGAVIKALGEIKNEGLQCNCKQPGVHEPLDVEYSILKQRLARRLAAEGATEESVKDLDLVSLTKVTERTISDDLEFLISKAVDPAKADYAVVTGVQIHNWSTEFDNEEPNLEWVAPTSAYVVVNGEKTVLDLKSVPSLTPRQIRLLASAPDAHNPIPGQDEEAVCNSAGNSTLREIDPPYMYNTKNARRKTKERLSRFE